MSYIDLMDVRASADPPSVQAFRAFVAAVERGDLRQTILCQRELRRFGFGVFVTQARHAPPVHRRRDVP